MNCACSTTWVLFFFPCRQTRMIFNRRVILGGGRERFGETSSHLRICGIALKSPYFLRTPTIYPHKWGFKKGQKQNCSRLIKRAFKIEFLNRFLSPFVIKVASINHFNGMNSKIPQDGDKIRVIAYLMRWLVKVQLLHDKGGWILMLVQRFSKKKMNFLFCFWNLKQINPYFMQTIMGKSVENNFFFVLM